MLAIQKLSLRILSFIIISIFFLFFQASPASAQAVGKYQKENMVPNLEQQFLTLQHHGDALAYRLGVGYDSRLICRHYQGMARSHGYGIPYLFLTRSGVHTFSCSGAPDTPGELLIVEMGSRNVLGERFGNNRLQKGRNLEDTAPPIEDLGVKSIHFGAYTDSNETLWPGYMHPGSVQLIDDVLIVALESYCHEYNQLDPNDPGELWHCKDGQSEQHGAIGLIDVSDPLDPTLITVKKLPGYYDSLGVVAATYIKPGEHPVYGGKYLLAFTWGDGKALHFAVIHNNNLKTVTGGDFEVLPIPWHRAHLDDYDDWSNWQTIQFFRDQNDQLYLLCGDKSIMSGKDFVGLFKFHIANLNDTNYPNLIEYRMEKHLRLGEPDMGSLDAAGAFYVSPTGQLLFYSVSHTGRDTWDDYGIFVRSVEMGEYRSILVSHTGTCGPQWQGGAADRHLAEDPYEDPPSGREIQEGENLSLDGRAYFIEPWVHMFEDELLFWYDIPVNFGGLGLMMDWRDQWPLYTGLQDDFNDFDKFKFSNADFKDRADAFIFCGFSGDYYTGGTWLYLFGEPGYSGGYITVPGTGSVFIAPDLKNYYGSNIHDDFESAMLWWVPPADPKYVWGLNAGAQGTISVDPENEHVVEYTAGCGSYTDTLYMKVYGKNEWTASTQITVENAAPQIDISLQSSGVGGSEVTLSVIWSDPCPSDVSINMDWGDGNSETIDDPPSDVIEVNHTYATDGIYSINASISDGYGGTATAPALVIIQDTLPPVPDIASLPDVKGECSAIITTVPTATDNISGIIEGTTTDPLTYNEQGTYTVTWTFDDGHGNTSTQTQSVIVQDVTAPVPEEATLPDISGECSAEIITVPTATDNCVGSVVGTTSDPLTYTEHGTHSVTWTYDDKNGNTATQTQIVIVQDVTAPVPDVATLPDVSGECSAEITTVPTATDNCTGSVTGTTSDPRSYTEHGTHTVTWTFDDGNGNTSIQTQTVTIEDITPPEIHLSDPVCVEINKWKMANMLTVSASDNCSSDVEFIIDKVEVLNRRGWRVWGRGVYSVNGSNIYVYPKGRGWSVRVTVTASDSSGNASQGQISRSLLRCNKMSEKMARFLRWLFYLLWRMGGCW
jgi:hypothetical protein